MGYHDDFLGSRAGVHRVELMSFLTPLDVILSP